MAKVDKTLMYIALHDELSRWSLIRDLAYEMRELEIEKKAMGRPSYFYSKWNWEEYDLEKLRWVASQEIKKIETEIKKYE